MRFEIKATAIDDEGNREEVILTPAYQDVGLSVNHQTGVVSGEVSFDDMECGLYDFEFKPLNPAFKAIKESK